MDIETEFTLTRSEDSAPRNICLMQAYTLILLMHFTQGSEDYWAEDFDENKNCVREEEMKVLRRETEPGRCASAAGSGNLSFLLILLCISC